MLQTLGFFQVQPRILHREAFVEWTGKRTISFWLPLFLYNIVFQTNKWISPKLSRGTEKQRIKKQVWFQKQKMKSNEKECSGVKLKMVDRQEGRQRGDHDFIKILPTRHSSASHLIYFFMGLKCTIFHYRVLSMKHHLDGPVRRN